MRVPKTTHVNRKAWRAGFHAAENGKSISSCDIKATSDWARLRRGWWVKGWKAFQDMEDGDFLVKTPRNP